jgi:3-polyprenyl-4-hydroxybenzoate decarboxylase
MTMERKPAVFGDLRGWIAALKAAGDVREIDAQVDWNIELGTIMRLAPMHALPSPACASRTIRASA